MKPELSVVGIDLAKSIFHLVGMDERGKIIVRKRMARGEVLPFMAQLPRVLVGMEACGGAHDWARPWRAQGHEVELMAPQYVKPYVKTNKNDLRDAEAIAEAVRRPSLAPRARTPYGCAHGSRQRNAGALGRVWYRVAHRGQRLSPRMGGDARSGTRQVDPSEPGTLRQAVGRIQAGG